MIASKARSEAKPSGGGGAGFARAVTARLAGLAAAAGLACAGGKSGKTVDLTPFAWTWSQVWLGDTLLRYGHPKEPEPESSAADFSLPAAGPGASETPLAAFHFTCAREEEAEPCTVFLDFRLLQFEPPLAGATLEAHRARLEQLYGALPVEVPERAMVRDAHGREWYHRALELGAGASFAHYSRPIDVRRALAVTSYTTRQPDRVAARDLARAAIDRTVLSIEQE
jgi:hypothetical protein